MLLLSVRLPPITGFRRGGVSGSGCISGITTITIITIIMIITIAITTIN